MEFVRTSIEDVWVISPKVWGDERGYFYESYSQQAFADGVELRDFVQDNQSYSRYGVIRGLHFQRPPHAQSKLVRAVLGTILDVAVDLRHGSPTYGQHVSVILSQDNHKQLYIPRGFAHGFAVLSQEAILQYKCDAYYAPESEGGIAFDSPELAIDWGVKAEDIVLSDKDRALPNLSDLGEIFRYREDDY